MAGSINKCLLIGNLGKDPQIRATQDGREIASLSIATSESWKDKQTGERKEKVTWHNVVIFNENIVKVAKQYLRKGSKVYIEGQLQTRKWTDKDGVDRYVTEIVLQGFQANLTLLDKAGERGAENGSGGQQYDTARTATRGDAHESEQQPAASEPELNDELGF